MLTAFARAFRTPDLRKKLLFTLGIIVLFRLGSLVPVPGVSYTAVQKCLEDAPKNTGVLGLANLFPVAVERAGTLAGPSGVATASTLGYGGMLLGPPAIGFLADWISLPAALTSVAALAAVAAVIGALTRRA